MHRLHREATLYLLSGSSPSEWSHTNMEEPDGATPVLAAVISPLLAAGIETVLAPTYAAECVHAGSSAVALAAERPYVAAIIDLDLTDHAGFWTIREIRARTPDLPLLALASPYDTVGPLEALEAGASGCISKRVDRAAVPAKIADLVNGHRVFDEHAASALFGALGDKAPAVPKSLTPREIEVLRCVANGEHTATIAVLLHLSQHTVRDIVQHIFRKLEVHDRAAAVAVGFRRGLIR